MVLLSYLQELIGSLKSLGSHITVEISHDHQSIMQKSTVKNAMLQMGCN
jgi:hypothetical protein